MPGRLRLTMGLHSVRKPRWPSEPDYVAIMEEQIKVLQKEVMSIFSQIEDISEEIMLEAMQPIFETARDVYCPIKTGELRESGYLEGTGTKSAPRVEVGFAKGGHPRYGVYVHEMTGQYHEPPTRAKFLQQALMEDLDGLRSRLERGYREFMNLG